MSGDIGATFGLEVPEHNGRDSARLVSVVRVDKRDGIRLKLNLSELMCLSRLDRRRGERQTERLKHRCITLDPTAPLSAGNGRTLSLHL